MLFHFSIASAQEVANFEKPDVITQQTKINYKTSSIYIPIEMDQNTIKKLITNATPPTQTLEGKTDTDDYTFKFNLKNGATSFTTSSLTTILRFTEGNGTYKTRKLINKPWPYTGTFYTPWVSVNCNDIRGNADLKVSLSLQPNYQIKAKGELNANIDNIECATINVASLAKTMGWNKIKEDITQTLNSELQKIKLKKSIQELWTQLQKPYPINNDFTLVAHPIGISYSDLTFQDGLAKLGIGLTFSIATVPPNDVNLTSQITPLPEMKKWTDKPSSMFEINIPVNLPYTFLDKTAKDLVNGYEISNTNDNGKVKKYGKIHSVEITGSKEPKYDVVIALNATLYRTIFKKKVIPIYLHAKLGYDPVKMKIFVSEYKLDPKTENGLYNLSLRAIANKLAYGKILAALQFNVEKEINTQKDAINTYLKKEIELTKGIKLSGVLDVLDLDQIIAQPNQLTCVFTLKGNAKIQVMDISF